MKWQTIATAILSTIALIVSINTLIQVKRQRRRLEERRGRLEEQHRQLRERGGA